MMKAFEEAYSKLLETQRNLAVKYAAHLRLLYPDVMNRPERMEDLVRRAYEQGSEDTAKVVRESLLILAIAFESKVH